MKIDQNTVAVITGGSSGLGEASVKLFLSLGAKVVIGDLNDDRIKSLLEQYNNQAIFQKTDVSNEEDCKNLINLAIDKFKAIHIVLNCAGIFRGQPLVGTKNLLNTKTFIQIFMINVVGTVNISKYAALYMSKQSCNEQGERGVIINVSSNLGYEGTKGTISYSASKVLGAIMGITLPMSRDLGKFGIRVMTLAPGPFETPIIGVTNEKEKRVLTQQIALGRFGDPKEFADAVVGIVNCSYLTGEILRLNGGQRVPNL